MIKLDILSDPICPWCHIGKAHLDRALETRTDSPFAVEWHPFQLNPDMPAGGMDRREYLEGKFGGRDNAARVYGRIAEAAAEAGIEMDFDAISRTPNTLDAHRMIHWASKDGRQTAVVSALFKAYFHDGRDIGDHDVLCGVAVEAGMDPDGVATRRQLRSDADRDLTRARDALARERGVTGVPTFVVGNRHVLPGAQPPDMWLRVIEDLSEDAGAVNVGRERN